MREKFRHLRTTFRSSCIIKGMIIIQDVTIPDFSTLTLKDHQDVTIKEGKVASVNDTGSHAPLEQDRVISGRGLFLIPGMVNSHAHTAMTLLRGTAEDLNAVDWFNKRIWIYEQSLSPRDVYVGSLIGAAEMLLNGVTCTADHYFAMDQAWSAFDQAGLRADLSWAVFGGGPGSEEAWEAAEDFIRIYRAKNFRITVSLGPHSPYLCPDDFLRKVASLAEERDLKVHIHAAEDERQMILSRENRGKSPLDVLEETGILRPGTILAHAYWADDRDLDTIARSGAGVAHCPKTYMRFGDFHDFLPRALSRGIKVGLGSDGPASNSNMNLLEAARLAALLAKGTTGRAEEGSLGQILPLLFGGGALAGLDQPGIPYGTIVPGALADLVLIRPGTPEMLPGNNFFADLLYGADGRNVDTVLVDGQVVVDQGRLTTVNFEDLAREAREIAARLVSTRADKPMQTY